MDSNSKQNGETTSAQDEGALKDSTDSELSKISLMRAFVESRDPSSKVVHTKLLKTVKFATFYYNLIEGLTH